MMLAERALGEHGLVGLLDLRAALDRASTPSALADLVDGAREGAYGDDGFAVAHSQGDLHVGVRFVCAFEGRLTNAETLARSLNAAGDRRPAELVATAFAALGERALQELRGEFVLVLWDAQRRRGLIARDRGGGRAVFLRSAGAQLAFASDVKLLLGLLPRRPGVDSLAVTHWLALGQVPAGRTLFEGIRRLPPGTVLSFDDRGVDEAAYSRPTYAHPWSMSRDEAATALRSGLRKVVSDHVRGDERVGIRLSGGLDSSFVAATASEVLGRELVGYSLTFPRHPSIDESPLIGDLAGHLGIESVQMQVLGGSMLRGGLEFLDAWSLPTPSPTTGFTAELLRHAAADGITVMLDGEGGDELFAAAEYLPASCVRRGSFAAAWALCHRVPGFGEAPPLRLVARALWALGFRGAAPYWVHRARRSLRGLHELAPAWLAEPHASAFAASFDPWSWKRSAAPLWWSHLMELVSNGREGLWVFDVLRQTAAGTPLATRHPLLDPDLLELVLRLPPEYAFDGRYDRALMRRAMRGMVPEAIRTRSDKSFFTDLMRTSLLGDDLDLTLGLLGAPDAEILGFVDRERLEGRLRAVRAGTELTENLMVLWRFLMMECWLRSQADSGLPERLLASRSLGAPKVVIGGNRR